jgi:hypothetical protein
MQNYITTSLQSKASPRSSSTIAKQGQATTKNKDWSHKRGMNARLGSGD